MKPIQTTLFMALIALASMACASYFFPWPEPEQVNKEVGSPLFENYTTEDVRGITLVEYDDRESNIKSLDLRRKKDRWSFPNKSGYNPSQAAMVALTANSLQNLTILEFISDEEIDHVDYGVIDPNKSKPSDPGESIGRKLVLEDRSRQTIAAVIVGKSIKATPTKRFVRRVDKPQVFIVDFSPFGEPNNPTVEQIISARFSNWIDPNLFQLGSQGQRGLTFKSLEIENYRIPPSKFDDSKPDYTYRGTISVAGQQLAFTKLEAANDKGELRPSPPPKNQTSVIRNLAIALRLAQGSGNMVCHDVRRKDPKVAEALRAANAETDASVFAPMANVGFRKTGFADRQFEFESTGGRSILTTQEGIKITATIGTTAGSVPGDAARLTYHVLFTAGFDESKIPTLDPLPEDATESVIKEFKKNEIAIEELKQKVASSLNDLNTIFSDWYFILDEDTVEALRPELDIEIASSIMPEKMDTTSESEDVMESKDSPKSEMEDKKPEAGKSTPAESDSQQMKKQGDKTEPKTEPKKQPMEETSDSKSAKQADEKDQKPESGK